VSTNTLSLSAVAGKAGYQYRAVLAGTCNTVTSGAASIVVHGQVGVTASPTDKLVCPSETAAFTAAGTPRSGTLRYQWQSYDGQTWMDIAEGAKAVGTQTATLTYGPNNANTTVRCRLRDDCGAANEAYSLFATYINYPRVSITTNPTSQTLCPGGSTTLSIAATAATGELTYQWQQSSDGGTTWTSLQNQTYAHGTFADVATATLVITNANATGNSYRYRCGVRDDCAQSTESYSTASVLTFYTDVVITGHPQDQTICPGGTAIYSASGTVTNGSPRYQWQVSVNTGTTYSNLSNGSGYAGVTTATLTLTNVTTTWPGSLATLRYRCVVSDACGAVTAKNTTGAALALYGGVAITTLPADRTICPATNTTFPVVATGQNGALTYQWEVSTNGGSAWSTVSNAGVYTNASTATLTLTNVPATYQGYKYRVRVADACGTPSSALSSVVTLSLYQPVSVTVLPADRTICPAGTTTFEVTASPSFGTLGYQWQESRDNGQTYADLGNGSVVSQVTTAALKLTAAPVSMSSYRYRVNVSDGCGTPNRVTSAAAVLTFHTPVSVMTQPVN
jgi:hypothetical protein